MRSTTSDTPFLVAPPSDGSLAPERAGRSRAASQDPEESASNGRLAADEPREEHSRPASRVLLVVEDSDADREALDRVLRRHRPDLVLEWCSTGEQAQQRLSAVDGVLPGLILLDLNMPDVDGRDVLLSLKGDSRLRQVPVVVLTTSTRPQDVEACYALGAREYLVKPIRFSALEDAVHTAVDEWLPRSG